MAYVILIVALIIALIIAAFGWLKNRIALLSLCYFMETKNYPPPTEEEAVASSKFVIKQIFTLKN